MKVTFYRKDSVEIDLEWMAQKLISLIKFNLEHEIEDLIQDLIISCLQSHFSKTGGIIDFEFYDNYYDLLEVITNNVIVWCAENNELFYDTILKYRDFLEACDK